MDRARRRSDDGAVAVEFALLLPVFIVLLLGIIEFGAAYNAQILLTNAAREAARTMSVTGIQEDAVDAAAAAVAAIGLEVDSGNVEFAVVDANGQPAGACVSPARLSVAVTVEKPLLTGLFGTSFTLTGNAVRQCGG